MWAVDGSNLGKRLWAKCGLGCGLNTGPMWAKPVYFVYQQMIDFDFKCAEIKKYFVKMF